MTMRAIALGVAVAGFAFGAALAQTEPKGDPNAGEAMFNKMGCYSCHGAWGQGTGRDGPRINPPMAYPAFLQQLRTPRYEMPPYVASSVTDQQVADMHAYLAGLPKGPAPNTIRALQ